MKIFPDSLHIRDTVNIWLSTNTISKWLFRQNRSIIFNRSITRKIISYYDGDGGHLTNLDTGNLGYGFIHYSLILSLKPRRVLCIGSRKGFIPAVCALACAENGQGYVDFVDAGYGPNDTNHWSGVAWWKKVNPARHFSFLDVNKMLTTYIMTTAEFAATYPKRRYDYIYIDGDHSYEGVMGDWALFWPKLSHRGFMVFHDVVVHQTKNLGVFGAWRAWKKIGNKHAILFPFPKESGLGIIQKV
jgi:Methyltransferase domain